MFAEQSCKKQSGPSVNGSRVRFWEDFLDFHPMAYERTASGGKREKIPKYGTDKYRSSEHIIPLHSDLSIS